MDNNTKYDETREQSDTAPLKFRPEAPDTAERRGPRRQRHKNVPENTFATDRHTFAEEALLVHQKEKRKVRNR